MGAEQSNTKSTKEKKPMKKMESVAKKPMKKTESVAKKPMKKMGTVKKGGFRLNSTVPPSVKHTVNFWKEYYKIAEDLRKQKFTYEDISAQVMQNYPEIDNDNKITNSEFISLVNESINKLERYSEPMLHSKEAWNKSYKHVHDISNLNGYTYQDVILYDDNNPNEKITIEKYRDNNNARYRNVLHTENVNNTPLVSPITSSRNNGKHTKAYWEKYYQITKSSSHDRLRSLNIHAEILQSNPFIDSNAEMMTSNNFLNKYKHENMPYSALSAMSD